MLQKFKFYIIITVLFLIFLPGFSKLQKLRLKLSEIEKEVVQLKTENKELTSQIDQLKNDEEFLEIVARNRLGVVKKGETVLKIIRDGEEE